ncbi:MAG TPA: NADPH:quinone oxidoreductase family protein [Kofleriaceae bacterium]|nr:NADPH:quinone oxidoreductase family protein [Kofleriaceae bacterium]
MRAVRCHELVGPQGLRVDEVPDPQPGAGQIAIQVRAAGVNFPDVLLTRGKYQFKPPLPFSPGGEASGVVAAVGPGVTSLALGDRVAATVLHGAFAERLVVPEMAAVVLPDGVDFETGAATLLTYSTTYHALVDRADLRAGETLLVLGASGGVGLAAVELGKLLGARVIAAASTDDKLAFCREHGADEGICYATEDLKERVKALTGGSGADVIYDPVGGPYSEPALRAIAWQGRHLVVGFAAGDIPRIPLNLTLLKGCQIVGVFWGAFAMREPQRNRDNADRLFAWVAERRLAPHVDDALPFTRAAEALERLERREVKGKLVLIP